MHLVSIQNIIRGCSEVHMNSVISTSVTIYEERLLNNKIVTAGRDLKVYRQNKYKIFVAEPPTAPMAPKHALSR